MTTLLLIRHGHHILGPGKIAGRMAGVHLSSDGIRQANDLAERLAHVEISSIYASPLERTRETATILCQKKGLPLLDAPEMLELDFGQWEGHTIEELKALPLWKKFNSFRSGATTPGGEWMLDTQSRAVKFLLRLQELHPEERVAVVSHGDLIKAAVAYFLGVPLDLFQRMEISPASLSIVCLADHGPFVLCVNETGGYPPLP